MRAARVVSEGLRNFFLGMFYQRMEITFVKSIHCTEIENTEGGMGGRSAQFCMLMSMKRLLTGAYSVQDPIVVNISAEIICQRGEEASPPPPKRPLTYPDSSSTSLSRGILQ
jgi:hypothetical protein